MKTVCGILAMLCAGWLQGQELPGKGLAQHDFLYSGEAHERRMYLVRGGKVVWSYDDPAGKGEISDMVMLSNGNILFAHQFGVTLISPEKKVLWNYDTPAGHEVHTAVPIGTERVLYIQNGDPAVLRVVNIKSGAVEREIVLATKQPVSVHPQFRHARLTAAGTLMVAHMDLGKVAEYDSAGKELWSFPAVGPWGVTPLANGNVLITDKQGVREITRRGDAVWTFAQGDAPEWKMVSWQNAWRLANGDTLMNNWINQWAGGEANAAGGVQALEVDKEKNVVWVLGSWDAPNLGPATSIQVLEGGGKMEDVRFGEFR